MRTAAEPANAAQSVASPAQPTPGIPMYSSHSDGSHATDAGSSFAFHQGMMYHSSLMNREQSWLGQAAMVFSQQNFLVAHQAQQNQAKQNYFAHQAHIAFLRIPPMASNTASHSSIPVDVTVLSAGQPESCLTTSVKPLVRETWNSVPRVLSFSKKPRSNEVSKALHGGPHACCPSLKFRVQYSKVQGKIPYVIYKCDCEGSARIKVACVLPGVWRLFFNQGGEHSSTDMETLSGPVLLPAHKEYLKELIDDKPNLSRKESDCCVRKRCNKLRVLGPVGEPDVVPSKK
jgi:hypothetical protein